MQDTSECHKYIKGSNRPFHTEDREWCCYYQQGMKGIPLCKNVCQRYMYQRYFTVLHKSYPNAFSCSAKGAIRPILGDGSHIPRLCIPALWNKSLLQYTRLLPVLHLSSYLGTWSLINKFKWNFVLQNLFDLHSFCCTYYVSVPCLVIEITKTVNKWLYGRILFEQAQYDVKARPVSPLWLYTTYPTYLFLKAWHLAVDCTGYLQDGSRIGWFTLNPEAIHCAGHCNVSRPFFFPRSLEIWEM